MRVGVYPGSFNPPTTAHLAIARSAREQRGLDRLVLTVSRVALAKHDVERPRLEHRLAVLRAEAAVVEWLEVRVTESQLLVDIARDHDVLVMGADKWLQVNDPAWYGDDPAARDRALAALPELAIAPRAGIEVPARHLLRIADDHGEVSSTAVRAGRRDLMTPLARRFDDVTGAWSDPDRYDRWAAAAGPADLPPW
jgi:nicotinic acid mononucleotide adenylyltransferase